MVSSESINSVFQSSTCLAGKARMFQPGYKPHPGFSHYPGCLSHAKNPRFQKEKAGMQHAYSSGHTNTHVATTLLDSPPANALSYSRIYLLILEIDPKRFFHSGGNSWKKQALN